MKQKLIALYFFGQLFTSIYGQTMNVIPTNGVSTAYSVEGIKKLTFSKGKPDGSDMTKIYQVR